ncbi:MAG: class I SAM-dependent RNA methyltransferase [Candidatus Omnitrophica bacterium]|nr:23S rRNA (uracil-C(5))-methyltransferase RlmCD [bacterium]NUN97363.1 class I SAM-dependent RNA methyltransferase [Candidatus Omnitrophota bacterium]
MALSVPPHTRHSLQVDEEVGLAVDRLNSMGEGVGRKEGAAVFTPGVLPGEQVTARIVKSARDFARAVAIRLESRSLDRVEPRCPLHLSPRADGLFEDSRHCGGCQLQSLQRAEQLEFKRGVVHDCLTRIGGLEVEVLPTAGGHAWGYRNKMAFSLATKNKRLAWGLRALEAGDEAVPLESCDIARPELWKAAGRVLECLNRDFGPTLAWDGREGLIRGVTLRSHTGRPGLDRTPHDRADPSPCIVALFALASQDAETALGIVRSLEALSVVRPFFCFSDPRASAVYYDRARFLNMAPGRNAFWGEAQLREERCAWHTTGEWSTLVGPTSFLQVNDEMAEHLYRRVLELPFGSGGFAVDAYCGVGILTRALAGRFERVVGIEVDPQSIKLARTTARRLADCRVEWIAEPAEAVFGRSSGSDSRTRIGRPDLVILDPPRKGCQPEVLRALLDLLPVDVVYISCHPAALARDLKVLCRKSYGVATVEPFDLFPQTHHVETLVHLKRK